MFWKVNQGWLSTRFLIRPTSIELSDWLLGVVACGVQAEMFNVPRGLQKRQMDSAAAGGSTDLPTFSVNLAPSALESLVSPASSTPISSDKVSGPKDSSVSAVSQISTTVSTTITLVSSSSSIQQSDKAMAPSMSSEYSPTTAGTEIKTNGTGLAQTTLTATASTELITSTAEKMDPSSSYSYDTSPISSLSNVYLPSYISQDTMASSSSKPNILADIPLASVYDLYKPSVAPVFHSTSIDVYTPTIAPTPVKNALPVWTPDQLGGGYGFGYYGVPQQYRVITEKDLMNRGLDHLINPNSTTDNPGSSNNATAKHRMLLHKREASGHDSLSTSLHLWVSGALSTVAAILYL